jgi:flavodoxin
MKALIIYDSVFGNTEEVARSIGSALGADVPVINVRKATPDHLKGLDLLVVGSPTRSFSATPEMLQFLQSIPSEGLKGLKTAAFDTRIDVKDVPFLFRGIVNKGGYAAPLIAKFLAEKGAIALVPPQAFFVKEREGPMKKGELERAAEWAKSLLTA